MPAKTARRKKKDRAASASGAKAASAKRARHSAPDKIVAEFPPSPVTHKLIMGTAVTLPFVGCLAAIVLAWQWGFMGWLYVGLMVGGWLLTGLGITVGFHRLLTHRSFDTYRWVKLFWMTCGALSVEGSQDARGI